VRRVCCHGPGRIDCCTAGGAEAGRAAANAGSATFTADVRKLNADLSRERYEFYGGFLRQQQNQLQELF